VLQAVLDSLNCQTGVVFINGNIPLSIIEPRTPGGALFFLFVE
jgi:hypothetical protein